MKWSEEARDFVQDLAGCPEILKYGELFDFDLFELSILMYKCFVLKHLHSGIKCKSEASSIKCSN